MIKISKDDISIKVRIPFNHDYIRLIKKIKGYSWRPEEKAWCFPYSEEKLLEILDAFSGEDIDLAPPLKNPFRKNDTIPEPENLKRELALRKYSRKTIKAYIYYNRELFKFAKKTHDEINNDDIKNYLYYLADVKKFATSTLNIAINALKFYYGNILHKSFIYDIKRPKKDKKLPVVLNSDEINKIMEALQNIKHRAILMLVYSAGLRVSEVVKLKFEDIDAERKIIFIRGAKGRKDRCSLLSEIALEVVRLYHHTTKPEKWLFPGQNKDSHITTRTVEKIFDNAANKSEIKKDVSVHSLRHSFATHLLESGVDLRYIQEILGHKSSKTTEIYTHVSNKSISKILNPLDRILKK